MSKQHQNTKVFMNSPKYDLGSVQLSSTCLDIQGLIPVSAQTTVILQCCTEYPLVQHPVVMHRYPRFQNSSSMVQYCCPGLMVIPWALVQQGYHAVQFGYPRAQLSCILVQQGGAQLFPGVV